MRRIPLSVQLVEMIRQHSKVRRLDSALLFPGKNPDKPICFNKSWLKALKQAGIDNFTFHDLRHSAASYMVQQGFSLALVGELLGHRTEQMTKRYAHLSDSTLSEA